jgi:hypothetical protein
MEIAQSMAICGSISQQPRSQNRLPMPDGLMMHQQSLGWLVDASTDAINNAGAML